MRTQDEILARVKEVEPDDFLGFEYGILLNFLDFEHAKPYLVEGTTKEKWEDVRKEFGTARQEMIGYMEFAWEKANDCRGISASRTMGHYRAWLWLEGNEDLIKMIDEDYQYYGKDILVAICKYLDLDPNEWDDGVRTND